MKRTLLAIVLLLISLSALSTPAKVETTTTLKPKPRSGIIKPNVYVDTDVCQLTISMVSGEFYVN